MPNISPEGISAEQAAQEMKEAEINGALGRLGEIANESAAADCQFALVPLADLVLALEYIQALEGVDPDDDKRG